MDNKIKEGLDKVFDWHLAEKNNRPDPEEIQVAFDRCDEIFGQVAGNNTDVINTLTYAVCDYGEECERKGFKDGFRIAFQIFNDMNIAGKKVS